MIELLLILVICGVGLYLVETYIPMSPPIKVVIRVVVVLILVEHFCDKISRWCDVMQSKIQ